MHGMACAGSTPPGATVANTSCAEKARCNCKSACGFTKLHCALVLPALLLPASGLARAADPCGPTLDFFPTADEIGAPQLVNNKTCKGSSVCNFPAVWSQKNQSAYADKLKTSLEDGLLKVAFKQYGNEKPRLFFTPVSAFLSKGSDVTECAVAQQSAPATRRMLQDTKYTVKTAGQWSYSVSYDGAPAVPGTKIAGKSGQLDPTQLIKDVSIDPSKLLFGNTMLNHICHLCAAAMIQSCSVCMQLQVEMTPLSCAPWLLHSSGSAWCGISSLILRQMLRHSSIDVSSLK